MLAPRATDHSPHIDDDNPYVGPRPFTREDVERGTDLYGRDREVNQLFDLLVGTRIVLLHSPSGAGKTSLIQAKLIPKLEDEDFEVLPVTRVSRDASSVVSDAEILRAANRYLLSTLWSLDGGLAVEQQKSAAELAGLDLATYLEQRPRGEDEGKPQVLIFDQFEEILTVDPTDRAAKEAFLKQVGTVLRERDRWALFAMREDYVAALDPYLSLFPTRLRSRYRLDLLESDAAFQAITEPARAHGVEFTDQTARALIDDLRMVRIQGADGKPEMQPGLYVEPVQLQVVCRGLWEQRAPGATQMGELGRVGGVDEILAAFYRERVQAIAARERVSERAIREWFEHQLITTERIRGQVMQEAQSTGGLANEVIGELVKAHLVRAEQRRGVTWFELAHDRLIGPVQKDNEEWLREKLVPLQRDAAGWDRAGRPENYLLAGDALTEAESWAAAHPGELTDTEQDFLDASRQARNVEALKEEARQRQLERAREKAAEQEQRAAEQTRAAQRQHRIAVVAWVFAGLALILMFVAAMTAREAEAQRQNAVGQKWRALAYQAVMGARAHQTDKPELALFLAQQSLQFLDNPDARFIVLNVLRTLGTGGPGTEIPFDSAEVSSLAFNPGGEILVGTTGGPIQLAKPDPVEGWRKPIFERFFGHEGRVSSTVFSPDGKLLASGGTDGTIRLWDLATRQQLGAPLPANKGGVSTVVFHPDGLLLASGGADGTIRLWDLATRQQLGDPLEGHPREVSSLAISPLGDILASGGADGTIRLWDLATRQQLGDPLEGHLAEVSSIAFSPKQGRRLLASGGADETVRVWDIGAEGRPSDTLLGHKGRVSSVAFSPRGEILASGSSDGTIHLWNIAAKGLRLGDPLQAHEGGVSSVVFRPDSLVLASGGADGAVRFWDVDWSPDVAKPVSDTVASKVCGAISRSARQLEWQRYFEDEPYHEICSDQ